MFGFSVSKTWQKIPKIIFVFHLIDGGGRNIEYLPIYIIYTKFAKPFFFYYLCAMIYKPFFRDDLGYKPRYTQPLHLEEVVVSPIYSENEDYKIDLNSLGYKPIYNIDPEGVVLDDPKSDSTLSYTFSSKEDFKSVMLPIYEKVLSEKGINPMFANSLVAQDGLESA